MKTTHCILYNHVNRNYMQPDETGGTCLDYHDSQGNRLKCMDAITNGHCCKKRKTPVL